MRYSPINKIGQKLAEAYEMVIKKEAIDMPPAIVQQKMHFTPEFVSYIKRVENNHKKGYKNGHWFPYRVSNKEIDIGYGHKINPGENFSKGITDDEVEALLIADLQAAEIKAKMYVNQHYGKGAFENLDRSRQEMLTDFAYNLGSLVSFPKFTQAVVYNDIAGMKKEYIRTAVINGQRQPLNRNNIFFDTFLKNYKGGYFIAQN